MTRPLTFLLLGCSTAVDTGPDACVVPVLGAGPYSTLQEMQEFCAQQPGMAVNESIECADGRIEYHCQADSYSRRACHAPGGELLGYIWWDTIDDNVEGKGEWCDCDGDGWPPTVEEYCERRGEVPPE